MDICNSNFVWRSGMFAYDCNIHVCIQYYLESYFDTPEWLSIHFVTGGHCDT